MMFITLDGWMQMKMNFLYILCSQSPREWRHHHGEGEPGEVKKWDIYWPVGKDIVFRLIIEYSSLRDFYRPLGNNNNNRSILYEDF